MKLFQPGRRTESRLPLCVGACLLIFGLLAGAPGMAVPATIVAGIGGILAYQNATGDWTSWSYVWSLIPGFVGLGIMLSALLGDGGREGFRSGLSLVFIPHWNNLVPGGRYC